MTSDDRSWARLILMMATLAAPALAACADEIPTAVQPCPCATGNVCCASGVCAASADSCSVATRALSEAARGTWSGYIENFNLGAEDRVRIDFAVASDGALSGQVILGNAAPPAAPTDPSRAWPEGASSSTMRTPPLFVSGFVYTAREIRWEAQRLKFRIDRFEPWQPWCALQSVHLVDDRAGGPYYTCAGPEGQPACCDRGDCPATVDCSHARLCSDPAACACDPNGANCYCGGYGVCECGAAGCKAATIWPLTPTSNPSQTPRPIVHAFDIALRANGQGQGSVLFDLRGTVGNYNLRLDKIIE